MMPASGWDAFAAGTASELEEAGGQRNAEVSWDGTRLKSALGTALDFDGSQTWDPRPSLAGLGQGARAWVAVADRLQGMLLRAHGAATLDDGILGNGTIARAFAARLQAVDFPVSIVGFGPGTTPSGDDWIAGYLCAADLIGGTPGLAAREFRNSIQAVLDRTTAAGRALLLGALAGAPPAYLVSLARAAATMASALDGQRPKASDAGGPLESALAAALRHGATSGADAVSGFVAGLRRQCLSPCTPLAPER